MKKIDDDEQPSRIEMNQSELDKLITEIRSGNISADTQEILIKVLLGWRWLSRELENKKLSLKKLMRLFFGSKTEKIKKDRPDKDNKPQDPPASAGSSSTDDVPPKPKPKGHGKNGQVLAIKLPCDDQRIIWCDSRSTDVRPVIRA